MATIEFLRENGCELNSPDPRMLELIYTSTGGNPCNGCNCKPTCPAWPKIRASRLGSVLPGLCPKCRSPLNMKKVEKRGGKCACGEII